LFDTFTPVLLDCSASGRPGRRLWWSRIGLIGAQFGVPPAVYLRLSGSSRARPSRH